MLQLRIVSEYNQEIPRTGYSKLSDYRHKLGQVETRFGECGQIETVQHYLLECPLYDEARYTLMKRLRN